MAAALPPQIDYLSKDFASFRRLMLDRLASLVPSWTERHSADLGVVLVELLAYAGDQLSYMQDAVATEAYLGTARRRISARRHARLLDYAMHDGCNARTFVAFQVGGAAEGTVVGKGTVLGKGTALCTQLPDQAPGQPPVILLDGSRSNLSQLVTYLSGGAQVFETMHDLTVHPEHNQISVNAGAPPAAGATSVVLASGAVQYFQAGDLVLIEQIDAQGNPGDPTQRQVVRLTSVTTSANPSAVGSSALCACLSWAAADAIAFTPTAGSSFVVRGNVALCDHGLTLVDPSAGQASEILPTVPGGGGAYRPSLSQGPVTQQGYVLSAAGDRLLFDPQAPAGAVLAFTMDSVLPALTVTTPSPDSETWQPSRDLLGGGSATSLFVAEVDDAGATTLRFGDGVTGLAPSAGITPSAVYRMGNGSAGNVGADTLVHTLVLSSSATWSASDMLLGARNPLAALGGTEPEALSSVQINAPGAILLQMRAVTEADHVSVLLRNPLVNQALAVRRYNGSFYTVVVAVQPAGSQPANAAFLASLRAYIEPYRLAGWDIQIVGPTYVLLDVLLTVQVAPAAFRSNVLAGLGQAFGTGALPSGQPAFFSPASFGFGQTLYFSQLVATAMQVAGVQWVDTRAVNPTTNATITIFQRRTHPVPYDPILHNAVAMSGPELPQLGSLVFNLVGGL